MSNGAQAIIPALAGVRASTAVTANPAAIAPIKIGIHRVRFLKIFGGNDLLGRGFPKRS